MSKLTAKELAQVIDKYETEDWDYDRIEDAARQLARAVLDKPAVSNELSENLQEIKQRAKEHLSQLHYEGNHQCEYHKFKITRCPYEVIDELVRHVENSFDKPAPAGEPREAVEVAQKKIKECVEICNISLAESGCVQCKEILLARNLLALAVENERL